MIDSSQNKVLTSLVAAGAMTLLAGCQTGAPAAGPVVQASDRSAINGAIQLALETRASGESESWQNPATGMHGTVTPLRTYQSAIGIYCREYEVSVMRDGSGEASRDAACRDSDGQWKDGS
ncbi:MAG: RT0821/Lpp0805 family surface protein [Alphaproteobacteria bacterium]